MGNISAGLATFLLESGLVGDKVYPLIIPKDQVLPAIAYQRIDTPRVGSHLGPSGLAHPRYQLTIEAPSYALMCEIAEGIRVRLDGYKGPMGMEMALAVTVVNETEFETGGNGVYIDRLDVVIWHVE